MTSIGMSNTEMEFGSFLELAHNDPQINSHLVLVNGAEGGAVIERWVDPANPFYAQTWSQLETKIAAAGLTDAQVQVAWVKVTQQSYQPNFPQDMQTFQAELETLARLLKTRFPNLKINYFSSRTRSFSYFRGLSPETSAFENGFAVRWMIEKQINGDPSLNFDPSRGAVPAAYLSWGPYLWIDGYNPRSDGRTWPLTNVDPVDCTHPTTAGQQAVAAMLMEFFKGDTTTIPWFLNPGVPTPTPPTTRTATPSTPTRTLITPPTPTRTPTLGATSTRTATRTGLRLLPLPAPRLGPGLQLQLLPAPGPPCDPNFACHANSNPHANQDAHIISTPAPVSSWGFATNLVRMTSTAAPAAPIMGLDGLLPASVPAASHLMGSALRLTWAVFRTWQTGLQFTLSVWVRPAFDATSSASRYVFSDGNIVQVFYLNQINDWRATVRTANSTYRVETQGLTWSANTWHLLTITYSGAEVKLYWDGALADSVPASGAVASDSGATVLGMASVGGSNFNGGIDELRVFASALTAAQVYNLFVNP